jgi:hypothetical protein
MKGGVGREVRLVYCVLEHARCVASGLFRRCLVAFELTGYITSDVMSQHSMD